MSHPREIDETCEAATLYALGCLPPAEARRVELRLKSGCPLCAAHVAESREVVEALASAATPQRPPESLKTRLLGSLAELRQHVTEPAAGQVVVRKGQTPWVASPMPGVDIRPLLGDKTYLVRMSPGAELPAHDHHANEQCLVVEGSITDAQGMTVGTGDYVFMPAKSQHALLRSDTGCVLLIAYT